MSGKSSLAVLPCDLHDEIGSSLSGIGILGTMVKQILPKEHPSGSMVERIVSEARFISSSLDDIVWSINLSESLYPERKDYGLTVREHELLQLLTQGYTYRMIGIQCNISVETVRRHLKNIYQQLYVLWYVSRCQSPARANHLISFSLTSTRQSRIKKWVSFLKD